MTPISLYNCKPGDIVLTGDSWRKGVAVCIRERGPSIDPERTYDVVHFLRLTDGHAYESGAISSVYMDSCELLARISINEVVKLKEMWKCSL